MFELIRTYTCNGCSATATESKAKKWTHLNNSPDNGKQNMDFCPKCSEMLSSLFATTINSTDTVQPSAEHEPLCEAVTDRMPNTNDTVENTQPTELECPSEVSEQYLAFYKQIYSRILFAIACDDSFDVIKGYLRYIPGAFSVDNTAKNTDVKFTLNCNGKRLVINKAVENSPTTESKIMQSNRPLLVRRVSKYTAVQALIEDTYKSTASLLPYDQTCYTDHYIKECLIEMDDGMTDGLPLRDLREWITYAVMQTGLELS